MKLFTFLLLNLLIFSCDAPQRTRFIATDIEDGPVFNSGDSNSFSNADTSGSFATEGGADNTHSYQSEAGFSTCNLAYKSTVPAHGSFGICKHSSLETRFKVKTQRTYYPSEKLCYIPMHTNSSGNQIQVGRVECGATQAGKVYDISFVKDPNYGSASINTIMVITQSSVQTGYSDCQGAKALYLRQIEYTPRCQSDPNYCLGIAEDHSSTVCRQFALNYSQNFTLVKSF